VIDVDSFRFVFFGNPTKYERSRFGSIDGKVEPEDRKETVEDRPPRRRLCATSYTENSTIHTSRLSPTRDYNEINDFGDFGFRRISRLREAPQNGGRRTNEVSSVRRRAFSYDSQGAVREALETFATRIRFFAVT